jgi:putative transposase
MRRFYTPWVVINQTVRYDGLAHYLVDPIEEVQDFATTWLWSYNHERPNMALGGVTPKQKLNQLTSTFESG